MKVVCLSLAVSVAACHPTTVLVTAPVALSSDVAGAEAPVLREVASAAPSRTRLAGTWAGTGVQANGPRWPVRVEISSATGECARAFYPSLDCEAVWKCTPSDGPDSITATEEIQVGDCLDHGQIRAKQEGNSLVVQFENDDVKSKARLFRSNGDGDQE